ncbi:FAD-binding domain-containing protein [Xylaria intraflava]|nr:FAD-binding domain-containing protein [Xylaria intraflava]
MLKSLSLSSVFAGLLIGALGLSEAAPSCRCVPGELCWPAQSEWNRLNTTVHGRLIKTEPVAQSCYEPGKDPAQCAAVVKEWSVQDFQTLNPVGRVLPWNLTCPPIDYAAGETPKACNLGINPVYAVNATTRAEIKGGLAFARAHNLRLTVTGTGHDLLGRSDGYGSLEIWLRHYRHKITFQKKYKSFTGCRRQTWKGSAIHIDGNYQWRDVAHVAQANNHIVTTGGSVSVGAIGGWPSGGGHGPATQAFGFGSDQILEAEVMLADGTIVTANACENSDLYRSLRGGGPGYGVVLSMTIKAHPNVDVVTVHHLDIVPREVTSDDADLMDALAVILQGYPKLIDAGVAGYTHWYSQNAVPVIGNSTSGYTHGVWTIGKGVNYAREALEPFVDDLKSKFSDRLVINDYYIVYTDYWSFYNHELAFNDAQGNTLIMTSRLIEREQVADIDKVREAVETISYAPGQMNNNVGLLVGGGQVVQDAADAFTGLLPAWRRASFAVVTIRVVPLLATFAERDAMQKDMFAKGEAMKEFAPGTGAYLNEADRYDPDYITNFYGEFYQSHLAVKRKYDPHSLFYCPTCVGSEDFVETPNGPLCRKKTFGSGMLDYSEDLGEL